MKSVIRKYFLLLLVTFIPHLLHSQEEEKKEEPPKEGNLSLRGSQQPTSLVSFGERILDRGQFQAFLFADSFLGNNSYVNIIYPYIVYGVRDDLSLTLNLPFAGGLKDKHHYSSGPSDFSLQLEYAFYTKEDKVSSNQATLVGAVLFPTGSASKNPPTGFGSYSYLLGFTIKRTEVKWAFFTSNAVILPSSKDGKNYGNQFIYQIGFAKNIPSPDGWIFAWLAELDGLYSQKNRIHGLVDHNSGGNRIYFTPSLWFSNNDIIIQIGAGYPIIQNLFGHQEKKFITIDFNMGVTF